MHDRNITHTKAYQLKSKMILHINAEEFSADWKAGIKLCLQEAEDLGIQSLAMPALGTGITITLPPTLVFKTLCFFTNILCQFWGMFKNVWELGMSGPY